YLRSSMIIPRCAVAERCGSRKPPIRVVPAPCFGRYRRPCRHRSGLSAMLTLSGRMAQLGTESAFEVLARAKALEAQGRSIINLGIGQPDFATPGHIVEAGRKALAEG